MSTIAQSPFSGGVLAIILIAGFLVTMVCLAIISGRRRRKNLAERFTQLNFVGCADPDKLQKEAAYNRFPLLHKMMKQGFRGVQWYAEAPGSSPPMFFLEHTYVVSTGKSSHSVYHTAAVVAVPRSWGEVSVTRETVFTKIGKVFGLKDLDLEDPAFNKAWRVRASDENFALALLTPEVQRLLADTQAGFRNETWVVGSGSLALVVGYQIKPDDLAKLHARVTSFVEALAPEVRAQIAGA